MKHFYRPKVLDLCCGVGGFSTAARYAGCEVVAGVDIDENAIETWARNHEGEPINQDIMEMEAAELKNEYGIEDIDIIVAGPPCNNYSKANRTNPQDDPLVGITADYIEEYQPTGFIIENVASLYRRHQDVIEEFRGKLNDDYTIAVRVLNSADYGTPQNRLRTFIIGINNNQLLGKHIQFPAPTHGEYAQDDTDYVTAGEALADLDEPDESTTYQLKDEYVELLEEIPPNLNYTFHTDHRGHPDPSFEWRSRRGNFLKKTDPDRPAPTITSKPGSGIGPFHWNNRKFTKTEIKRLQGFPDDFKIPFGRWESQRQLGKSIPLPVGYYLIQALYVQSKLRPPLMSREQELRVFARKRSNPTRQQELSEKRYEELGLLADEELDGMDSNPEDSNTPDEKAN